MHILSYPFRFFGFWLWYVKEFAVANVYVLKDILSRGHDSTPGIGRYLSQSQSEFHFTLIAALISVTPGTLVVGAGPRTEQGQRVMYVHGMYHDTADDLRRDLRDMEVRMLRGIMLRPQLFDDAHPDAAATGPGKD